MSDESEKHPQTKMQTKMFGSVSTKSEDIGIGKYM